MKRLTLLAVALTMVLGMAVNAMAAPEVTVSGNILVNAVWKSNWDFNDGNGAIAGADTDQAFQIRERFDLAFTAVANENLKAVIVLRSDREQFGTRGYTVGSTGGPGNGGFGTSVGVGVNQAYMSFLVPGTSTTVMAGYMPIALPAEVGGGNMIMDDVASAVMTSTAINDNVSLLAGWVRFADSNLGDNTADTFADSQIDGWVVALPLTFEGVSATPFFVYSDLNDNAENSLVAGLIPAEHVLATDNLENAWWAGTSWNVSMLDPFILKGDINYGAVNSDNEDGDRAGWLFDIALEYTGFDFMNLELAYAYTSGLDDDANEDGRMPVILDTWSLGTFWFGGGLITGDDIGSTAGNLGFHALALSATGIQSFAEGLTHDAHIVYAWGTNDEDWVATPGLADGIAYGNSLMEDDTMFEIDFNSFYKIYDELTLYNGISYIDLDTDTDAAVWGAQQDGGDAWKFQVGIKYVF